MWLLLCSRLLVGLNNGAESTPSGVPLSSHLLTLVSLDVGVPFLRMSDGVVDELSVLST